MIYTLIENFNGLQVLFGFKRVAGFKTYPHPPLLRNMPVFNHMGSPEQINKKINLKILILKIIPGVW